MQYMNRGLFRGILAVSITGAVALWSPAGAAADAPGSRPGDEEMTCEQIGAELHSYMQQIMPSVTALSQTAQEIDALRKKATDEAKAQAAVGSAALTATMLDPTGLSASIVAPVIMRGQVELAKRAQAESKPLLDKANTQGEHLLKEGEPLKSDARFQRLMQMDKEKNCH